MERIKYDLCLIKAEQINGIVYKTSKYYFPVAKSFWDFAVKVLTQHCNACYFELISHKQSTYLDLDLRTKDCVSLPSRLMEDPQIMIRRCVELL